MVRSHCPNANVKSCFCRIVFLRVCSQQAKAGKKAKKNKGKRSEHKRQTSKKMFAFRVRFCSVLTELKGLFTLRECDVEANMFPCSSSLSYFYIINALNFLEIRLKANSFLLSVNTA